MNEEPYPSAVFIEGLRVPVRLADGGFFVAAKAAATLSLDPDVEIATSNDHHYRVASIEAVRTGPDIFVKLMPC